MLTSERHTTHPTAYLAERCAVLPSLTTVFVGLPREEMLLEIDARGVVDE